MEDVKDKKMVTGERMDEQYVLIYKGETRHEEETFLYPTTTFMCIKIHTVFSLV